GRLRIAGVQARCLQGQGEESGEPEDRGEDIGLTVAEPCTGRRHMNADRTAEQRLGDPGAGLRGHDSRLSVAAEVQGPAVPVFGVAVLGAAFVSIVGAAALIAAPSGVLTASIVAAVAVIVFGAVITVAGILVVAGPVVVSVARGAVVLTAFVLGIGVLVLVLLVVVIRLLGRLFRCLVVGVVTVAAVVAARTAVAAARGASLGCGRLVRVLRLGLVGQLTASGELLDLL